MFFIAPFRTSRRVMPTPIRTRCRPSSTKRCVRSAQNVAPKRRPTNPDPDLRPSGSSGVSGRDLPRLARGTFYASDPRRAARRADGRAVNGKSRPQKHLHQLLDGKVCRELQWWVPVLSSQYSLPASEWRVCFVWRGGDAYGVEIVDYH